MLEWYKNKINDIDTNFLFNANRDIQFRETVKPYLETLEEEEEEEEEAEAGLSLIHI